MRRYTDEYRASALALLDANNGNAKRTAKELGISRGTLRKWQYKVRQEGPGAMQMEARDTLRETIEKLLCDVLGEMGKKLDTASYRDLSTSAGILADKAIALRALEAKADEPEFTDDERIARLALWIEAAREKTP